MAEVQKVNRLRVRCSVLKGEGVEGGRCAGDNVGVACRKDMVKRRWEGTAGGG